MRIFTKPVLKADSRSSASSEQEASGKDEPISFPVEGFDGGSISMLAAWIG